MNKLEMGDKMFQLKNRTGLNSKEFCKKFRFPKRAFDNWYIYHNPMVCIPYCIERILDYEDMYGEIKDHRLKYDDRRKAIRQIRKSTGLTQIQFCVKYKIKMYTLQSWEIGRSVPKENVVYILDKLVQYEKKYGDLPMPKWVSDFNYKSTPVTGI